VIFNPTAIRGVCVIEPERHEDERGFFARTWCQREFEKRGLNSHLAQCSTSFSKLAGTLRGMHYQLAPHAETKLVRCTRGSIYDVALDLRPSSDTFCRWFSIELTQANHTMLYIPPGVAHGFQTLSDDTEVFYQISEFYHSESSHGVRWNDPAFRIRWALPHPLLSPRDASYPDFKP
jgi:dTDP-4-dehydrorhamnose 3,5-epimerase